MKTLLYRASNLKSPSLFCPQFHSGSQFLAPAKNRHFLRFFHNIIKYLFRRVFSDECYVTYTTIYHSS